MQIFLFLFLSLLNSAFGSPTEISFEGKDQMNELSMEQFKDFEKNWKLVTVRFRKDTQEMRWTFANDMAWSVLQSGSKQYSDGAVFAKIGIRTISDSSFESSLVPQGARRYQFMVFNKTKYASTGGWGYALFDVNGKTYPEEPGAATQACFACHKIVENKGYIFSQPFALAPFVKLQHTTADSKESKITFESIDRHKLPGFIIKHVPANFKTVRFIANKDLRKSLFLGTLDEIKPTLEREAYESKTAALLYGSHEAKFSIVYQEALPNCKISRGFAAISSKLDNEVQKSTYCNP